MNDLLEFFSGWAVGLLKKRSTRVKQWERKPVGSGGGKHIFSDARVSARLNSPMTTFTETTARITVSVEPNPIDGECQIKDGVYVFAYTVHIENHSEETVQLMERHWMIESAGEQIGEVTGPGVIGVQPVLKPGEKFDYTSSTVIRDPIGAMKGSYVFKRSSGGMFVVQIPRFMLLYPTMYH